MLQFAPSSLQLAPITGQVVTPATFFSKAFLQKALTVLIIIFFEIDRWIVVNWNSIARFPEY